MKLNFGPEIWQVSVFGIKDGNFEVARPLLGGRDQVGTVQMHPLSHLSATKMI